jgi:hypothetical protein
MAKSKGVVLFIVLVTVMVVVLLANIAFIIIASQTRLTHHQISRIQGYYAALAGVNYAYRMLFLQQWSFPATGASPVDYSLCRTGCDINEPDLPIQVNNVQIRLAERANCNPAPPAGIPGCISATATYTYNPPPNP